MNKQSKNEELLSLVKQHEGILFKICNSYCNNKSDRQDLAQEIVYHLLKAYDRFKEEYKFSTWMYRVALNVAISFYRKYKTGNEWVKFVEDPGDVADEANESDEMNKKIYALQQIIDQMRPLDKALMLLYLEEKSYKEMSEILGITETNVATKISRIKEKLKQQFLNQNK